MGHFGSYLPKFGQKWIFLDKSLTQFLDNPMIYHRAKNQKKLMSYFWEKAELTDRHADRQTNGDFIRPSVGRGSNKTQENQHFKWQYTPLTIMIRKFDECSWRVIFIAILIVAILDLGKRWIRQNEVMCMPLNLYQLVTVNIQDNIKPTFTTFSNAALNADHTILRATFFW